MEDTLLWTQQCLNKHMYVWVLRWYSLFSVARVLQMDWQVRFYRLKHPATLAQRRLSAVPTSQEAGQQLASVGLLFGVYLVYTSVLFACVWFSASVLYFPDVVKWLVFVFRLCCTLWARQTSQLTLKKTAKRRLNAGPASQTLAQHWSGVSSAYVAVFRLLT